MLWEGIFIFLWVKITDSSSHFSSVKKCDLNSQILWKFMKMKVEKLSQIFTLKESTMKNWIPLTSKKNVFFFAYPNVSPLLHPATAKYPLRMLQLLIKNQTETKRILRMYNPAAIILTISIFNTGTLRIIINL